MSPAVWAFAGCDQKKPDAAAAQTAAQLPGASSATAVPPVPAAATLPTLNVGKLGVEKVTASGSGASASEAVAEALRLAILQVNGASIDMASVNTRLGIDVTLNQSSGSMRAEALARRCAPAVGRRGAKLSNRQPRRAAAG